MNSDLTMEEDPLFLPTTQTSRSSYNLFKWSQNGVRHVGTDKVVNTRTIEFPRKQRKNYGQLEKQKSIKNITNQKKNNAVQKEKIFEGAEQEKIFEGEEQAKRLWAYMNSLFMTLGELTGLPCDTDVFMESKRINILRQAISYIKKLQEENGKLWFLNKVKQIVASDERASVKNDRVKDLGEKSIGQEDSMLQNYFPPSNGLEWTFDTESNTFRQAQKEIELASQGYIDSLEIKNEEIEIEVEEPEGIIVHQNDEWTKFALKNDEWKPIDYTCELEQVYIPDVSPQCTDAQKQLKLECGACALRDHDYLGSVGIQFLCRCDGIEVKELTLSFGDDRVEDSNSTLSCEGDEIMSDEDDFNIGGSDSILDEGDNETFFHASLVENVKTKRRIRMKSDKLRNPSTETFESSERSFPDKEESTNSVTLPKSHFDTTKTLLKKCSKIRQKRPRSLEWDPNPIKKKRKSKYLRKIIKERAVDKFVSNPEVGTLVWAKMRGFPPWPAMIAPDPNGWLKDTILRKQEGLVDTYHVIFLEWGNQRAWIARTCMTLFTGSPNCRGSGARAIAINTAEKLYKMGIEERLESFDMIQVFKECVPKQNRSKVSKINRRRKKPKQKGYHYKDMDTFMSSKKLQMTPVVKLKKLSSVYVENFFPMIYEIDDDDNDVNLALNLINSPKLIDEEQENLLSGTSMTGSLWVSSFAVCDVNDDNVLNNETGETVDITQKWASLSASKECTNNENDALEKTSRTFSASWEYF